MGVAVHTLLEGSGEYSYVPSSFETDRSYSFLKVYVMIIIIDIMEKMMIVEFPHSFERHNAGVLILKR